MPTYPVVEIEIRNYARLGRGLRLIAAQGQDVIDEAVGKLVESEPWRLRNEPYPPIVPMQRYKRTGILANSWRQEKIRPGHWLISNIARQKNRQYAEYVVGSADDQAKVHRGRWWVGRDKIEEHFEKFGSNILASSLARRYQIEIDKAMS